MGAAIITLAIALTVFIILFSIWGAIVPPDYSKAKSFLNISKTIGEIMMVYICPPVGIATTNDPCGEHPFESSSLMTAYTLWGLFASAYFLSRYFKKHLSPVLSLLTGTLLIIGFIYSVALSIHFLPMSLGYVIPGINLLLLSPVFCSIYLFKEIIRYNQFYRDYFKTLSSHSANTLASFYGWLSRNHLFFSSYLLSPVLLMIQGILYVLGQREDSIISQFTESCGFLFSKHQQCSCGGDHYLCSVAANGNKRLVKPVRFGIRKNEKIIVNRQLLIANAFENWLEEYTPAFHRIVRKTYDAMNIPVNAWSKHKRMANIIYILMKPLEWLFLLWLYLFDKKPENRISTQYFPKKELQTYIQQHENS